MTDNRRGPLPPATVTGPARADALAAQATERPWLSRYRVPSQVTGTTTDYDTVQNLVNTYQVLHSVEPGKSTRMGPFVRFMAQTLDPDTGELMNEPTRLVAFAQPIVRFADHLAGGKLDGLVVLNPPVLVRIVAEGDVVLFVDP